MKISGNEDLRVQRTIKNIYRAFEDLICQKDYNKITVTELARKAEINKKTFYRYYPTLDDLLAEMQAQYSRGYIKLVENYRYPQDMKKIVRAFYEFSARQGKAYDKITTSTGAYSRIRQQMINQVEKKTWEQSAEFNNLNEWQQKILLAFIQDTSIACYREWINSNKEQSIDDMIAITSSLLEGGIEKFFKNIKQNN
ncbi:TetR/AcrR family transcriptional regulator [Lactobacillus hamsteri]|uniref:Transcription regulator n=1 Tax=Lactobacillus hamsteri DSM 5661 = JCM 6256 TaxID=1423754 RepID=A0A0R1YFW4_9LACO|nr:TetR/AcrR family transcriptional regulator [Lactobacillus hamsteri]KRM38502.1 transcription regulator [Lactobacillus hamsteri DSM 5661 = JCM 6256]